MRYATGYENMKYYLGSSDYLRQNTQWVALRLSDLYLTYAEALLQANNDHQGAVDQIDIVRARVGLPGLVQSNPGKRLLTDKDALIEELLRERVCELGMEDSRFFDLIRWKLYNVFEKQLHGLHVYKHKDTGEYKFVPYELTKYPRVWWTSGFEPRWCLSAFPSVEINKGYGLVQNPGWE